MYSNLMIFCDSRLKFMLGKLKVIVAMQKFYTRTATSDLSKNSWYQLAMPALRCAYFLHFSKFGLVFFVLYSRVCWIFILSTCFYLHYWKFINNFHAKEIALNLCKYWEFNLRNFRFLTNIQQTLDLVKYLKLQRLKLVFNLCSKLIVEWDAR